MDFIAGTPIDEHCDAQRMPLRERRPRDEVHHEVGLAICCGAPIQKLADVGMVEVRQNVPLGLEPAHSRAGIQSAAHHLQSDQLAVQIIHSHRLIDHAHAAFADHLDDPVGANTYARVKSGIGGKACLSWHFLNEITRSPASQATTFTSSVIPDRWRKPPRGTALDPAPGVQPPRRR